MRLKKSSRLYGLWFWAVRHTTLKEGVDQEMTQATVGLMLWHIVSGVVVRTVWSVSILVSAPVLLGIWLLFCLTMFLAGYTPRVIEAIRDQYWRYQPDCDDVTEYLALPGVILCAWGSAKGVRLTNGRWLPGPFPLLGVFGLTAYH